MKYYIKLERLTKVNKNAYKKIVYFYFILIDISIKIIHRIPFNMIENKTRILEIINID